MSDQTPSEPVDPRVYRAVRMLRKRADAGADRTHWPGCEADHWQCATLAVLDELDRLRAGSQPVGPTREQVAQVIESKLGYANGWRVTDDQYREDCLAAADQILGFGDAAPQEEGRG